jgi:hypothetical protein
MDILIHYVVCEGYIAKEVAIYILVISKCMGVKTQDFQNRNPDSFAPL